MLENLSEKLQKSLSDMKGYGKITEENVNEATRSIRIALLEADVNYKVVKSFISSVKEKALGEEVTKSLKPGEVFTKIVKDELVSLLGEYEPLNVASKTKIMMIGLQGSGKTTTSGKLALYLRKKEAKKPLLVACDVYRPAAIDQLKQIGKQLNIEVFSKDTKDVLEISRESLEYANENGFDTIIFDTAGRLHINEELMDELSSMSELIKPTETLLIVDAMIGQDAINVIDGFNENLNITGAILTKMDGNTKGGVALSVRHLTKIPIKFIGTSEKMDGIEFFDPTRMAERLLGMGDILSIVDKVEDAYSMEDAKKAADSLKSGKFTLEDFLNHLNQIKKMGPLENILKMMPGASKMGLNNVNVDPKKLAHVEAIILSMTPKERRNPSILKASRKKRIAKGAGLTVTEVNLVLKQYEQMKEMMKKLKNGNLKLPF